MQRRRGGHAREIAVHQVAAFLDHTIIFHTHRIEAYQTIFGEVCDPEVHLLNLIEVDTVLHGHTAASRHLPFYHNHLRPVDHLGGEEERLATVEEVCRLAAEVTQEEEHHTEAKSIPLLNEYER